MFAIIFSDYLVDTLSAYTRLLTLSYDAKVALGMEVYWGQQHFGRRNKLYLKIQDGRRQPFSITFTAHSSNIICRRNYCKTFMFYH